MNLLNNADIYLYSNYLNPFPFYNVNQIDNSMPRNILKAAHECFSEHSNIQIYAKNKKFNYIVTEMQILLSWLYKHFKML